MLTYAVQASNINVSLMNLGRCLEALRWNQTNPNKVAHVVPFRHSKLFQDHFLKGSKMLMIVAQPLRQASRQEALRGSEALMTLMTLLPQRHPSIRIPIPIRNRDAAWRASKD